MNKKTIKVLADLCFLAGKNNLPDKRFDDFFERSWRDAKDE